MDIGRVTSIYPVTNVKNLRDKTKDGNTKDKREKKDPDFEQTLKTSREKRGKTEV